MALNLINEALSLLNDIAGDAADQVVIKLRQAKAKLVAAGQTSQTVLNLEPAPVLPTTAPAAVAPATKAPKAKAKKAKQTRARKAKQAAPVATIPIVLVDPIVKIEQIAPLAPVVPVASAPILDASSLAPIDASLALLAATKPIRRGRPAKVSS